MYCDNVNDTPTLTTRYNITMSSLLCVIDPLYNW